MRPARSRLLESSRTAGISLLLESTSTCPRTTPESCSTAATIIRRPSHRSASRRRAGPSRPWRPARARCRAGRSNGVVQGLGRQRGEDVVEGGDRGRGVALLASLQNAPKLLLGEQSGELGEGCRPPVAGKPGRDGDRQHGLERIALAPGEAALGHLAQALEQAAQPGRRHRLGVLLDVPVCRHLDPAQRLRGAIGQFEHEDLLGLAVVAPARRASGLAGKAAREAQRAPVRRPVAGPGKARGVDEGLRQQGRVAVHRLDVLRQPPQAQPQHPRGQVAHPLRRQDDEARVVRDQMQAPELLLRRPADPAVARGQLERARLPADQCKPGLAMHRDMAQALADDAVERQVVVLFHQPVPAPVLPRAPGRTHRDRVQINGRIRGKQRRHDRHTATSITKWPAPRSPHADRWADKKRALLCGPSTCLPLSYCDIGIMRPSVNL